MGFNAIGPDSVDVDAAWNLSSRGFKKQTPPRLPFEREISAAHMRQMVRSKEKGDGTLVVDCPFPPKRAQPFCSALSFPCTVLAHSKPDIHRVTRQEEVGIARQTPQHSKEVRVSRLFALAAAAMSGPGSMVEHLTAPVAPPTDVDVVIVAAKLASQFLSNLASATLSAMLIGCAQVLSFAGGDLPAILLTVAIEIAARLQRGGDNLRWDVHLIPRHCNACMSTAFKF